MKKVFVNVDTQVDFMLPNGKLYVKDSEKIIPNLELLNKYIFDNKIKHLITRDCHYETSKELSNNPDFLNTFPEHCMINTDGYENISESTPISIPSIINWYNNYTDDEIKQLIMNDEIIITKDEFSAFTGNKYTDTIINNLKNDGYTDFYIYGVTTDICVSYIVDELLDRMFNVYLIMDATNYLNYDNYLLKMNKWNNYSNFQAVLTKDITV